MYILGGVIFIVGFLFAFKGGVEEIQDRGIFILIGILMLIFFYTAYLLYIS